MIGHAGLWSHLLFLYAKLTIIVENSCLVHIFLHLYYYSMGGREIFFAKSKMNL